MKNSFNLINNIIKGFLALAFVLFAQNGAYADFSFNDMDLKFVQVSDVHMSDTPDTTYKVLSHSKELLNSAIKEINDIKGVDFVIFTGDMVNEPTKAYYKDFFTSLANLDYPAVFAFGNHDATAADSLENSEYINKETVLEIIRTCNPYQNYEKSYFAFSPTEEYRVIVLDTTMGYERQSNGFLPDEQLEFLNSELENNQDKVVLIFQHHPVVEPFKSADHKLLNAQAYLEILKKYEKVPIAIFAGHYHAAKIMRRGNVLHVASPSLVTYPNAFRVVKVTNYTDRVDFKFEFKETKLKEVQSLSKSGLIASSVFAGLPTDRDNQFTIKKGFVPKDIPTKEELREQRLELKTLREEAKAAKKAVQEEMKAERKAEKEAKKQAKAARKKNKEQ